MLSRDVVLEVKRLLDEGVLSNRAIASRTGVSRGSVNAIACGDRGLHGRDPDDPTVASSGATVAQRCPECGGLVFLPCVLCEARRRLARRASPTRRAA